MRRRVGVAVGTSVDTDVDDGLLLAAHLPQGDDRRYVEEEERPHRQQRREERVEADAINFVVDLRQTL